jgi:amidase
MEFAEYETFDAVGLAQLVEHRDVQAAELIDAAAARIEAVNPAVNAVIWERLDAARSEADEPREGPFAGVPILIKDLVVEEGVPVTFGSVFFRDFLGETTSVFRDRIGRAGFIDLGRTNTPEFGLLPTTEPMLHGPTRNPWNLDHSVGGSSGGAAAAVAAGMVPLAQGSDGGGSIRIPASAAGLFGLKPSRGRNPRYPGTSIDYLSVEHVITRSVRDSAVFLDAVHGPIPGDHYWAPAPSAPFASAVDRDPKRLTIAFSTKDFRGGRVHPECEAAVLDTVDLLGALGHTVVEAEPAVDGDLLAESFLELWAALAANGFGLVLDGATELKPSIGRVRRLIGDRATMNLISRVDKRSSGHPAFEPFTFELARRSGARSQADLLAAEVALQTIAHQTAAFLSTHDMFLTPVLGSPPVPIGHIDQGMPWDEFIEMIFAYVAFTPLGNFAGLPAMSVPLHWTEDGLPVGSHFLGRFGAEETLFALAAQLERAKPWFNKTPPPLT